jgi:hypothetical protein
MGVPAQSSGLTATAATRESDVNTGLDFSINTAVPAAYQGYHQVLTGRSTVRIVAAVDVTAMLA